MLSKITVTLRSKKGRCFSLGDNVLVYKYAKRVYKRENKEGQV